MKRQEKRNAKTTHCTSLRQILNSPLAQQMARRARMSAGVGDRLYHGTRYVASVLAAMELRYSRIGDQAIFLTRSPQVAAYWALIERDDDEGRGGILIVDKTSLRRRYKIEPHHDPFWDHDPAYIDEMAEAIFGRDILDLSRHLIGVVREPVLRRPGATRSLSPARRRIKLQR